MLFLSVSVGSLVYDTNQVTGLFWPPEVIFVCPLSKLILSSQGLSSSSFLTYEVVTVSNLFRSLCRSLSDWQLVYQSKSVHCLRKVEERRPPFRVYRGGWTYNVRNFQTRSANTQTSPCIGRRRMNEDFHNRVTSLSRVTIHQQIVTSLISTKRGGPGYYYQDTVSRETRSSRFTGGGRSHYRFVSLVTSNSTS